eukprot:5793449-Amphidinium_carterae.1
MALKQQRGGRIIFHGRWQSLLQLAEEADSNRPGFRWWRWRGFFKSLRFPSLQLWNWSQSRPWLTIRTSCEGGMEMHAEPMKEDNGAPNVAWMRGNKVIPFVN